MIFFSVFRSCPAAQYFFKHLRLNLFGAFHKIFNSAYTAKQKTFGNKIKERIHSRFFAKIKKSDSNAAKIHASHDPSKGQTKKNQKNSLIKNISHNFGAKKSVP
jgi:hypothetical protein